MSVTTRPTRNPDHRNGVDNPWAHMRKDLEHVRTLMRQAQLV